MRRGAAAAPAGPGEVAADEVLSDEGLPDGGLRRVGIAQAMSPQVKDPRAEDIQATGGTVLTTTDRHAVGQPDDAAGTGLDPL
ncbi:hypothetical protein [Sinomonas terrae]|uniref:Uncharacterized protein n=1 Tax=Sinomonas terrae TaxID=2908838 RepID=A0ABS9U6U1_9MICC|nr:hypothetical protein [Sinomonas terrae]MCH6472409.1 hypothetical protein [Sinomonas terrae]